MSQDPNGGLTEPAETVETQAEAEPAADPEAVFTAWLKSATGYSAEEIGAERTAELRAEFEIVQANKDTGHKVIE
jgi:hypothetical protein